MKNKIKFDTINIFKQQRKFLSSQYILLTIFWIIFTSLMIVTLYLFVQERGDINGTGRVYQILNVELAREDITNAEKQKLYKELMETAQYNIIGFSLMDFNLWNGNQPILDWEAAWKQKMTSIDLAYSYVFICCLLAVITLCFYITINVKTIKQSHFIKRYELSNNYGFVSYSVFNTKIFMNFLANLTVIFTFFNFLTTIVAVAYGIILVIMAKILRILLKIDTEALVARKWWKSSNFKFFTTVLIIQNSYTLAKSFFASRFGVNIDLLIQIIIPIGTITVIVAVFIRNLLNSSVNAIKTAVRTINKRVNDFRTFLYSQKDKCLQDFVFHQQLPVIVIGSIKNDSITNAELYQELQLIDETIIFFKQHIKKPEQLNYLLYYLFNEINKKDQIAEIKENIIKLDKKNIQYK